MDKPQKILVYLSVIFNGDWQKIYDAISSKMRYEDKEIDAVLSKVTCKYVTIIDHEYPECLKRSWKPPFVLFYEGNINLLNDEHKISVVGSRVMSPYGSTMTSQLVKGLVEKNYVIVSGLAKGVDTVALSCAANKGLAVAFLGNGIDIVYPHENYYLQCKIAKKGLLISEYPLGTQPAKDNFPFRNRLIAFSSKYLLITEASRRSGTLITAGYAIDNGNDIMCVPHLAGTNSACNDLIQQGAFLVQCVDDVLYQMGEKKDEK